jgi:NAD(P)-dependent dehydrogenase (short-subunit alcohol dehydrogenase family)
MKIILVGATGTIGRHVYAELSSRHEVIRASLNKGDLKVDITSADSIKSMYEEAGKFDALISVAGGGFMAPFADLNEEGFYKGIKNKMMGQINLVLIGQKYINTGGSFTLTSGILSEDPIRNGTVLTVINSAVNGFVLAAAEEIGNEVRVNVVSPGLVEDSYQNLGKFFPGHSPVSMDKVTRAYLKSVEGIRSGEIIKVY